MKIHELRVGTKVKIRFKSSLDTVMCDGVITDDSKEYSIQVRIAEKGLNLQKVVNGSENITVIVPFYSDQTMRFINVEVSLVSFDTIDVKTEKDCQATERRRYVRYIAVIPCTIEDMSTHEREKGVVQDICKFGMAVKSSIVLQSGSKIAFSMYDEYNQEDINAQAKISWVRKADDCEYLYGVDLGKDESLVRFVEKFRLSGGKVLA